MVDVRGGMVRWYDSLDGMLLSTLDCLAIIPHDIASPTGPSYIDDHKMFAPAATSCKHHSYSVVPQHVMYTVTLTTTCCCAAARAQYEEVVYVALELEAVIKASANNDLTLPVSSCPCAKDTGAMNHTTM